VSGTAEALLARYARCFDTGDLDGLRECFAAAARLEIGHELAAEGRDAVVEELRRRRERHTRAGRRPWHLVSGVECEGDGDARRVRARYTLLLATAGAAPAAAGHGWYDDELVREAGGWRIARHRVVTP
jgi:3-phenylpropionate/cinnamic acid dioxygenase small subunit